MINATTKVTIQIAILSSVRFFYSPSPRCAIVFAKYKAPVGKIFVFSGLVNTAINECVDELVYNENGPFELRKRARSVSNFDEYFESMRP